MYFRRHIMISGDQQAFFGGGDAEQFRVGYGGIEEGVESQDSEISGQFPEVIITEEPHKGNLCLNGDSFKLLEQETANFRLTAARLKLLLQAVLEWGCSSVVEHLPFKQVADGSIPSTLN